MTDWYVKITTDPNDLNSLIGCIDFYENELIAARKEVKINGNLEKMSAQLPGIMESRFSQLQEIEAILEYLNIRLRKVHHTAYKKYLESYARELSSRDADKYADADEEVMKMALLVNQFALLRNQFLAIMKGLENKSFQINNLVKLRSAGLEDSEINY